MTQFGRNKLRDLFANQNSPVARFTHLFDSFHNKQDDIQWDDLRFPATQGKLGALDKPDFDYTNLGLLFPQNDASEKVYMVGQIPHAYKLGTAFKPHVHFIQDESETPTFKLSYRITANGGVPGSFTTVASTGVVFTYVSGSLLQVATFAEIAGVDDMSSVLDLILYREDNDVTGDVLVKELDLHYQIDSNGSTSPWAK